MILNIFKTIKKFIQNIFNRATIEPVEKVRYEKLCSACGRPVVIEVSNYCLRHPQRFGGKIYCKEHQYDFFNKFEALDKQLEKQKALYSQDM